MGEIIGAGLVAHVPTIMFDEQTRREINEGKEITLVPGLRRLRDRFDELQPDTIVILDTHWFTTFEHVLSAHAHRSGTYTSSELPRGMVDIPYDFDGDPELARLAADLANDEFDTYAYAADNPNIGIEYPTVNLLGYLHRGERILSVGTVQTGEVDDFLKMGAALGEAIRRLDRRAIVLASGGMSHRFWPLSVIRDHEPSGAEHIISPEARAADEQRLEWMQGGEHARIIDSMDEYAKHAPEGFFGHFLMMQSAIGGRDCTATGELYSEYEASVGSGHVHVWFDRPDDGWTA